MFEENFDGPTLNKTKWSNEINMNGGGNGEFQSYTDSTNNTCFNNILDTNNQVIGSALYLNPTLVSETYGTAFLYGGTIDLTKEGCTDHTVNEQEWVCKQTGDPTLTLPPIFSARISSKGKFSFTFGKVEIRMKLPSGDWLWPAIWLLPECNVYGLWPQSGEIDIMESRGNPYLRDLQNIQVGTQQFGTTLHFGTRCGYGCTKDAWEEAHLKVNYDPGFDKEYHIFTMIWNHDGFEFLLDGKAYPGKNQIKPGPEGFWNLFKHHFGKNDINIWNRPDINNHQKMAPFDQPFHFVLNLACGGVSGYFPDTLSGLPYKSETRGDVWKTNDQYAKLQFWENVHKWKPTWKEDNKAFKIDYIKVFAV